MHELQSSEIWDRVDCLKFRLSKTGNVGSTCARSGTHQTASVCAHRSFEATYDYDPLAEYRRA
ncbi:hypothetical protein Pan258_45810 [Symmachiella dynata]|nr:hypothetical protein Pan258_45810 [Symmachiella dynata]